jgi:hypothetical protein
MRDIGNAASRVAGHVRAPRPDPICFQTVAGRAALPPAQAEEDTPCVSIRIACGVAFAF